MELKNNKTSLLNGEAIQREFDIRLFYFAKSKDDSKFELMEMQDILSNIFKDAIKISEDYYIATFKCEFDVKQDEGFLTLMLRKLYCLEQKEEIGEPLEKIILNEKVVF
ncbi:hypothetical protein GCM10008906_10080 [Clostridium oceanicum]|uniref:Transposase n=1 Tax=Clostridium oceanicum TaxID=1543 RepID=A0ABP3UJ28_9CLOT